MGTSDFAVPALEALGGGPAELVAVVTRPDRRQGRGQHVLPSPVAECARRLGAPLLQPESVNATEPMRELRALEADLFVVVSFGSILSPQLLAIPRLGCLNLHASLLPRYRGAAPIERALWDGCSVTGVTTLWMDEGIDTGALALQRAVMVDADDDAGSLGRRLAEAGAPLLAETVALAARGEAPRTPQPAEGASYTRKIRRQDGAIDWNQDAVTVWNRQRAMTPRPGAFTECQGKSLIVESAEPWHVLPLGEEPGTVLETVPGRGVLVACRPGALLLRRVRPQDRKAMSAEDWARGVRLQDRRRLGTGASLEGAR
jgi:methionyl-tRNA formyltransferase